MNDKKIFLRALLTGFIGGLFWCTLTLVLNYFNIVDLSPKTYLKLLFTKDKWLSKWYGTIFTIFIYSILSMVFASIYYVLFKKIEGMVIGIVYGMTLFLIVVFLLPQLFTNTPYIFSMSKRSIITSACLFILYGTFIGYSISFDYYQIKFDIDEK